MTINWKIKLTNNKSSYYGRTDGTIVDDLDVISQKLGVSKDKCADTITNIRVVKVVVDGAGAIDRVKFTYLVETKDKSLEIEGNQHGNPNGGGTTYEFKNDLWLLNVKGTWGNNSSGQTLFNRLDFWGWNVKNNTLWTDGAGNKESKGSTCELFSPACFFSRTAGPETNTWKVTLLGAIGCYWGEISDGNVPKLQAEKATSEQKWTEWANWGNSLTNVWIKYDTLKKFGDDITVARLTQVADALTQLEKDKTNLNSQITTLTTDKQKLQTDLTNSQTNNTKLTADNQAKDTTISDLNHTIKDLQKIVDDNKDLPDKIKDLNKQLSDKDTELGKRNDTINTLTNEKTKAEQERDTTKGELKKYTDVFPNKTPEQLKADIETLNKRPNITQEEYNKILNNQEKHTPDQLEKHTETDLKPADYETIKTDLNKWLGAFPANKYSEGAEDVSQALTAAEAKVTKLKSDKEELMKIVRQNIRKELTLFFQAMEISSSLIGKRFKSDEVWKKTYGTNFDYEDIVDEKLTLENRESMKMAFKVVACICATEKAEELKAQLKKIDAKLKKRIDNINENWKVVENYTQIDAKDNPFYLNVINERQKYKTKAENLMNEALQVQPDK
ncbi:protein of unknown function (coil-coil domain) [endosymbiont DhMRE of Dentiscutata heterogama]|uniref:hypothetical protein n=1 Tax=endosymbiont DhMRE of Dentiscutata heterogama TaxID=1609546 RepID=UPI000629DA23|nr:hypothetical protein [endosymbiont DhMRE of Dentiscutata heterogama]CFW92856.1 protein of unknown function (coil-coil domain) [endosymbiont DhMRE of Dentiscutata heterogama]